MKVEYDHYQRITDLLRKDYIRQCYRLPYGWDDGYLEPVRVPENNGYKAQAQPLGREADALPLKLKSGWQKRAL